MSKKVKEKKIKKPTPDFLIEQLPTTRKKQFFDILKNEWRTILLLGVILVIFFIPFIVSNIFEYGFMSGTSDTIRQNLEAEGKSAEEITSAIKSQMNSIHLLFTAINIVCFMIFSIGLAGVSRIIKCLSFGEGVIFKSDFFIGVKKYWKPFLIVGFFAGLFYFLMTYTSAMINAFSVTNSSLAIVNGLTIGFYYAILVPLFLFSLSQATLYNLPFFKSVSNSIRFILNKYYISIIFCIILYAISFLTYIIYPIIEIICFIVVIIFIVPLIVLAFHLFALSLFDKYINKDYYPEIHKKGLYIKETDCDTLKEK